MNPRVPELLDELNRTYWQKNTAYGDSFHRTVRQYGLIAALARIADKFHRAEHLILAPGTDINDESLRDTLMDLAGYAIMTAAELEGNDAQI